jgi:hypothetical protein
MVVEVSDASTRRMDSFWVVMGQWPTLQSNPSLMFNKSVQWDWYKIFISLNIILRTYDAIYHHRQVGYKDVSCSEVPRDRFQEWTSVITMTTCRVPYVTETSKQVSGTEEKFGAQSRRVCLFRVFSTLPTAQRHQSCQPVDSFSGE